MTLGVHGPALAHQIRQESQQAAVNRYRGVRPRLGAGVRSHRAFEAINRVSVASL